MGSVHLIAAMGGDQSKLWIVLVFCILRVAHSVTDPNDVKILNDFRKGLENPELLKWPDDGDDPCGPPLWPHVFCNGDRVSQIQVQGLGLKGPLPRNFNQLSMLYNLGLQRNHFNGQLPTFRGLSELQFAFLDYNEFDTIPADFFEGLTSIRVLALDSIPLNATAGWSIPDELQKSVQLTNLSLGGCNLVGPLPEYLGTLPSLMTLKLSYNRLSGEIPASFGQSLIQILWLNDQDGGGMSGPIDVIGSMVSLTQLWLHGNQFSGTIPASIGGLTSLKELNLNGNKLVGLIPESLANMKLQKLDLNNNHFMGPIPKFKSGNVSYASNSFCQSVPGLGCSPEVNILLDFLAAMDYPLNLVSEWFGNDPCKQQWLGLGCNPNSDVSVINLPNHNLNGTLSPSIGNLDSLVEIRLGGNNLTGTIPVNLTKLGNLKRLDVSGNNFEPPLPNFHESVKLIIDGNPLLAGNKTEPSPPPGSPPSPPSPLNRLPPPRPPPPRGSNHDQPSPDGGLAEPKSTSRRSKTVILVAAIAVFGVLAMLVILLTIFYCKKRKGGQEEAPSSVVVHPKDPFDPNNMVKIAVSNNTTGSLFTQTGSSVESRASSGVQNAHKIESGNLIISVQVLRKVTNNFAPENELGRGGFGAVYKGELEDGTKLAVKRMEAGVVSNTALEEFQAEIAVLSKVRHRHLVSLLGHSIEGNERLLVYEFMPHGALSRHLFHWKNLKLEPLSWKMRLSVALDVARGMEYLHGLAHESFIHRDLKSSNILLGDDFRAKVADFGLVKLAPDRGKSVATRLAGTFGYLAPEYAGKSVFQNPLPIYYSFFLWIEILP